MRKLALAVSVVLIVVSIASCNKKGPESVVKKYYEYFYKCEYGKIQDLVLEEHRSFYGLMDKMIPAEEKEKMSKKDVSITDVKCKIADEEAICSCNLKIGDQEAMSEELKLKKVDKTWLVDQGKENNKSAMSEEIVDDEGITEDDFEIER